MESDNYGSAIYSIPISFKDISVGDVLQMYHKGHDIICVTVVKDTDRVELVTLKADNIKERVPLVLIIISHLF